MKNGVQIAFTKSDNKIGKISVLFLGFFLSINVSGQNIQTILSETWTGTNWQNLSRESYTYDGSDHITNILIQDWDEGSINWINSSRTVYTNNPDGTPNQMVIQSWDELSSDWVNEERLTFTYNTSKKVLTTTAETWAATDWQNFFKQTNTYDGSGFLTNTLSQNWNEVSSEWDNNLQYNYTNNPDGTANQVILQVWDDLASEWNDSQRSSYTYNTSKEVLTTVTEMWTGASWINFSRHTNTYDTYGYLTHELSETWDFLSSSWKNSSQSTYTNNGDGTPNVRITQSWDLTNVWINSVRETYTYIPSTAILQVTDKNSLTIYPNPAHDIITIKANEGTAGSTYSITDQNGKLILTGILSNESTTVDISRLSNGLYFLHLGEGKKHVFKILKK
jgi:hypothetical protein